MVSYDYQPDYQPVYRVSTNTGEAVCVVDTPGRHPSTQGAKTELCKSGGRHVGRQPKALIFDPFFILSTKSTKKIIERGNRVKMAVESLTRVRCWFGSHQRRF